MEKIEVLKPSFISLFLTFQFNGQPIAVATGFLLNLRIGGYVLVTARHNVTGRNNLTGEFLSPKGAIPNEVIISHNRIDGLGTWIKCKEKLYLFDEQPRWHEHPVLKNRADFIALPLTQLHNVEIHSYDLNRENSFIIKPTDMVSVVGFPFGITVGGGLGIWATGFVASEPGMNYEDLPIFLIDCRTRQGQSGSPVIAHRNPGASCLTTHGSGMVQSLTGKISDSELLGVYSGRVNAESDIGMVWKLSAIKEMLDSIPPKLLIL